MLRTRAYGRYRFARGIRCRRSGHVRRRRRLDHRRRQPDFAAGDLGAASWATYVVDDGFAFAGGWAEWGATTAMMADSVGPIEADVLVVLAGTNDVAFGIPFDESAANLDRIVDVVGIEDVVVVSIPPMDAFPAGAEAYNDRLDDLAGDRGWRFVDASAGLRTADGGSATG